MALSPKETAFNPIAFASGPNAIDSSVSATEFEPIDIEFIALDSALDPIEIALSNIALASLPIAIDPPSSETDPLPIEIELLEFSPTSE
ncbi:hypothetical protein STFE110948_05765 [Streptobacillus felis]